jgi:hypothetical protein
MSMLYHKKMGGSVLKGVKKRNINKELEDRISAVIAENVDIVRDFERGVNRKSNIKDL